MSILQLLKQSQMVKVVTDDRRFDKYENYISSAKNLKKRTGRGLSEKDMLVFNSRIDGLKNLAANGNEHTKNRAETLLSRYEDYLGD